MLPQDPNVILVGEIRDQETADIALQAAQTGHLLLSTLHTNNVIGHDHQAVRPRRPAVSDRVVDHWRHGAAAGAPALPGLRGCPSARARNRSRRPAGRRGCGPAERGS